MKKLLILFILLFAANLSAQWSSQTTGVTNDLLGIFFIDLNTGWACGWAGKIIKSTDGGATWVQQNSTTSGNLNSIFFIDSQTGWCVGDRGKILKTNDGGVSWLSQTSGTTSGLYSVHFTNAELGFCAGEWARILKTTNGGGTWEIQTHGTMYDMLWSVKFSSSTIGYAFGGSFINGSCLILTTSDAGQSWTSHTAPTSTWMRAASLAGTKYAYAAGDNGTIIKTSDFGSSWTITNSPTTEWLYSVAFVDSLTGWIGCGNGVAYKTTDGGTTWAAQNTTSNNRINALHFFNKNVGWGACDGGKLIKHFKISSAIGLVTPIGGENLNPGAFFDIKWVSTDVVNVKIELSLNSGSSYNLVAGSTGASQGIFRWEVANTPSNECRIKISDVDNPSISAISSSPFSIVKPKYGDVDLNNVVQAFDASQILGYLLGSISLTRQQQYNANVTGDTTISAYDASVLLQYIVYAIDTLPYLQRLNINRSISFGIPSIEGSDSIKIPVILNNGLSVASIEGLIDIPENIIECEIIWNQNLSGFNKQAKVTQGKIRFVAVSAGNSNIPDALFDIKFKREFKSNLSGNRSLKISKFRINEFDCNDIQIDLESITTLPIETNKEFNFEIKQNYPNPFNPSTTIVFTLSQPQFVKIEIFNSRGQLISTLLEGNKSRGNHSINFNASGLASGVYFYKFSSITNSVTRKMIYLE